MKLEAEARVELNEIEIYLNVHGEKMQALKNMDTLADLVTKGLLKEAKLKPSEYLDTMFGYWNQISPKESMRESLYVKLKHPLAL